MKLPNYVTHLRTLCFTSSNSLIGGWNKKWTLETVMNEYTYYVILLGDCQRESSNVCLALVTTGGPYDSLWFSSSFSRSIKVEMISEKQQFLISYPADNSAAFDPTPIKVDSSMSLTTSQWVVLTDWFWGEKAVSSCFNVEMYYTYTAVTFSLWTLHTGTVTLCAKCQVLHRRVVITNGWDILLNCSV